MSEMFRAERDTIAALGVLTSNFIRFDPALTGATKDPNNPNDVGHGFGFNVHCLILDNTDGEVLAIERNRIHADDNPLQHAEQVALRVALARLQQKRPREVGQRVDKYYKSRLFMAPGTQPEDYLNLGCTLYNTFDPCGLCATTLLVAYMKRIAFLFDDEKFAPVFELMATKYFTKRDSVKERVALGPFHDGSKLKRGADIIVQLGAKVKDLQKKKIDLVFTLDHCYQNLQEAAECLMSLRADDLGTKDADLKRNVRTLEDIKRICRIN